MLLTLVFYFLLLVIQSCHCDICVYKFSLRVDRNSKTRKSSVQLRLRSNYNSLQITLCILNRQYVITSITDFRLTSLSVPLVSIKISSCERGIGNIYISIIVSISQFRLDLSQKCGKYCGVVPQRRRQRPRTRRARGRRAAPAAAAAPPARAPPARAAHTCGHTAARQNYLLNISNVLIITYYQRCNNIYYLQ